MTHQKFNLGVKHDPCIGAAKTCSRSGSDMILMKTRMHYNLAHFFNVKMSRCGCKAQKKICDFMLIFMEPLKSHFFSIEFFRFPQICTLPPAKKVTKNG